MTNDLLKYNLVEHIRINMFDREEIQCMHLLECDDLKKIGGLLREAGLIFRNAMTLVVENDELES